MLGSNICARILIANGIRSTRILSEGKYTGEGRKGNGTTLETGKIDKKKKTLYQLRYSAYSYDCTDCDSLQYYLVFMNVKKPVSVNAIKIQNGSKNL